VGKVIAIGPGGQAQAPKRDDRCRPVITAVLGAGLLDRKLLSPPCRTMAEAAELRAAMYRSARYFCSCGAVYCTRRHKNIATEGKPAGCPRGGQRISCQADVVKDAAGKWRVQFRLMDKQESMRAVVRMYGPDPNKWPYFSRRKKLKED
jgi:hypothetical protein